MGTLKELISALEHFPQDKPVVIRHNGEDHKHEAALIWLDDEVVIMEIEPEVKGDTEKIEDDNIRCLLCGCEPAPNAEWATVKVQHGNDSGYVCFDCSQLGKLQIAPCVLEELAKRGYGIAWNPLHKLFWPFSVDDITMDWWHDNEGVANRDFGTAVNRLHEKVQDSG